MSCLTTPDPLARLMLASTRCMYCCMHSLANISRNMKIKDFVISALFRRNSIHLQWEDCKATPSVHIHTFFYRHCACIHATKNVDRRTNEVLARNARAISRRIGILARILKMKQKFGFCLDIEQILSLTIFAPWLFQDCLSRGFHAFPFPFHLSCFDGIFTFF